MLREGMETRRFSEPEEFYAARPGLFFQVIPIGSGPFEVDLTTIQMGDVSLHIGRSSPLMGFAKAAPDRAILQLPIWNVETLVLNGAACQRGMVGVYGSDAELLRA